MARKKPSITFPFIMPYLMMRSSGYRSDYYGETLQFLDRWGFIEAIEFVPFRFLDWQFMYWKSGYEDRNPDWSQLYSQTLLARCKNHLFLDDEATYSITHTLFYLTDFGNYQLFFSQPEVTRIIDTLESLLIHNVRLQNWDITGELLINLSYIGQPSYLYLETTKLFLQAWKTDGSVSPNRKIEQMKLNEEDRFWNDYHTTLVAILFCAIALRQAKQGGLR